MNVVVWGSAALGAAFTVLGIRATIKGRRVAAVPFRRPSEVLQRGAAAAGARGLIATEGHVGVTSGPLVAPMSGRPCLAFEMVIERTWEKQVRTERDATRATGKDRLLVRREGAVFQLGDGAGAVVVDASGPLEGELVRTHASAIPVGDTIPPTLTFGACTLPTPLFDSSASRTLEFLGTERVFEAPPTLFALGELRQTAHGLALTAPEGGALILSSKGRAALAAGTRRAAVALYAAGGALLATAAAMALAGR